MAASLGSVYSKELHVYRKKLPDTLISFSSTEGKSIFKEAHEFGNMEHYFALAAQFRTQDEPNYCGLSTLVMVLNSLAVDPKRIWKGIWRWYHEDMLSCCLPLQYIKDKGMNMDQFACLAACNALQVNMKRADSSHSEEEFRQDVIKMSTSENLAVIVNYSRTALHQTGSGHFSPLAGYHPGRDLVLILDTARFKYPPYWVKLSDLWKSLTCVDSDSGLARGYFILQRMQMKAPLLAPLFVNVSDYLVAVMDPVGSVTASMKAFLQSWKNWIDSNSVTSDSDAILQAGINALIESLTNLEGDEHLLETWMDRNVISSEHIALIKRFIDALDSNALIHLVQKQTEDKAKNIERAGKNVEKSTTLETSQGGETSRFSELMLKPEHFITLILFTWPYDSKEETNGAAIKKRLMPILANADEVLQNEVATLGQQLNSLLWYLKTCGC